MGSAEVLSVAWAPDGASLASGSVDKTVRIFNLEDGACQKVLEGHRCRLNAALGKSVIGETGAGYSQCPVRGVGVTDSCICNRQTRYGSSVVKSVSFSPDGKTLASASWDKTVRIFNLEDGTCQKVLKGHR